MSAAQVPTSQKQTEQAPRVKVESIEEIKDSDKTRLSRSYTIWVMMKQNKQQQESEEYESVLKPVATFNTVRNRECLIYRRLKISGRSISISEDRPK